MGFDSKYAQIEAWSLEKKSVLDCMGETCASSRASCHTNMVNDRAKLRWKAKAPEILLSQKYGSVLAQG